MNELIVGETPNPIEMKMNDLEESSAAMKYAHAEEVQMQKILLDWIIFRDFCRGVWATVFYVSQYTALAIFYIKHS